jgi:hypothetical protein
LSYIPVRAIILIGVSIDLVYEATTMAASGSLYGRGYIYPRILFDGSPTLIARDQTRSKYGRLVPSRRPEYEAVPILACSWIHRRTRRSNSIASDCSNDSVGRHCER